MLNVELLRCIGTLMMHPKGSIRGEMMVWRSVARALALLCLWVAAAQTAVRAQSTQPAAAATTTTSPAATVVPVDQASPRGTLKVLAISMDAGDVVTIHNVFHTVNVTEQRMVATMSDMAAALAKLRGAALQAYGEAGARDLSGDRDGTLREGLAKLDAARESIEGDRATVTTDDAKSESVTLVRIDGQWKLPMSELAPTASAEVVDQRLTDLAAQIQVITETADEISAGAYPTPTAAGQALRDKMMKAAMQQAAPPSTAPTTQPK